MKTTFATWLAAMLACSIALANGGPFFERHVDGSNAVSASMAGFEHMIPGLQDRIACLGEDLTITIENELKLGRAAEAARKAPRPTGNTLDSNPIDYKQRYALIPEKLPRITVEAKYTLVNTSDRPVNMRFGFPVIYSPHGYAKVLVDGTKTKSHHLSLDDILLHIRSAAAEGIAEILTADKELSAAVATISEIESHYDGRKPDKGAMNLGERTRAAKALTDVLKKRQLTDSQVALVSEFFILPPSPKPERPNIDALDEYPRYIATHRFFPERGVLERIGVLKATQLYTEVLKALAPAQHIDYEQFFRAWGGQEKRVSLDLETGEIRERVLSPIRFTDGGMMGPIPLDIYAREEYLDSRNLPKDLKKHLMTVLRNLPVTFAFAPVNMTVYDVAFAPGQKRMVAVEVSQLPSIDGREPVTAQFEYIMKTARYFEEFDHINLEVRAPSGTALAISPACAEVRQKSRDGRDVYRARITDYSKNLYIAIGETGARGKSKSLARR